MQKPQPDPQQYDIEAARLLLRRWAAWIHATHISCRGYPKSVAFIHAGEPRETDNADKGYDDLQATERAMCRLKAINRDVFMAVLMKYYMALTNTEAAQRLNVSERTRKTWCTNGEHFILGSMTKST